MTNALADPSFLVALTGAGMTDAEARAYLALLDSGPSTVSSLAARAGISRQAAYPIIDRLESLGVVVKRPGGVAHIEAASPALAVRRLIDERRREVQAAEVALPQLQALFGQTSDQEEATPLLRVLRNQALIIEHLAEAYARAEREILVVIRPPFAERVPDQPLEASAIARGVALRTIYPFSVLQGNAGGRFARYLKVSLALGEDARFHADPPAKMVLVDAEEILLTLEDATGGDPAFTALFLRHRRLGTALRRLFEMTWDEGLPLSQAVALLRPETRLTVPSEALSAHGYATGGS